MAVRKFSGKRHSSCYPCMKGIESFQNSERPHHFAVSFNFHFVSRMLSFFNFSMFGSIIGCVLRCPKDKLCDKSLQKGLFTLYFSNHQQGQDYCVYFMALVTILQLYRGGSNHQQGISCFEYLEKWLLLLGQNRNK